MKKKQKNKIQLPEMKNFPAHIRKPLTSSLIPHLWPGYLNTPHYNRKLRSKRLPDRIIGFPSESINGSSEYGHALIFGEMIIGGYIRPFHSMHELKNITDAPSPWLHGVHAFHWLRNLQAVATSQASKLARQLTDEWFNIFRYHHKDSWHLPIMSERIINIFSSWNFIHERADAPFRLRMRADLVAQATHLERRYHSLKMPEDKLITLCAILWCGQHLQDWQNRIPYAMSILIYELKRQILPDGCHISRSPFISFKILGWLTDLAYNLSYNRMQVPAELEDAILKLGTFIRSMRHEDGTLALFNDSLGLNTTQIDALLTRSKTSEDIDFLFKYAGYVRLHTGQTTVLMDLAHILPATPAQHIHSSPMAFELSSRGQKIITNAGADFDMASEASKRRRESLKSTRAHSTLSVASLNAQMKNIKIAKPEIFADGDRQAVCASHNGWEKQGWIHQRSLWLSYDGNELMGQDILKPVKKENASNENVILRFHLEPHVKAQHIENYPGIVIYLPDGEKWYFDVAEGRISLGRGTWMGQANDVREIQSIVVPIPVHNNQVSVDWRFYRLS